MATGILMLNLGGPKTPADVGKFLHRLFSDRTFVQIPFGLGKLIARFRTAGVTKQYEEIGGSPLLHWTNRQGEAMVKLLDEMSPGTAPHKFYPCFRYAEPLTEQAIAAARADGVERMIAFTQYPQYCCASTGNSVRELIMQGFEGDVIWRWGDHPRFIQAWVELITEALGGNTEMPVVFTAHSVPAKVIWDGDQYLFDVSNTVHEIMKHLPNPFRICWQSKVGRNTWLQPATQDVLKNLGDTGHTEALLVPIAFTSEHLETLYEIDLEFVPFARESGIIGIKRCPAPNDHPTFIRALAEIVAGHLDGSYKTRPFSCIKCIRPAECARFPEFTR